MFRIWKNILTEAIASKIRAAVALDDRFPVHNIQSQWP